jgi:hypothetical protein
MLTYGFNTLQSTPPYIRMNMTVYLYESDPISVYTSPYIRIRSGSIWVNLHRLTKVGCGVHRREDILLAVAARVEFETKS